MSKTPQKIVLGQGGGSMNEVKESSNENLQERSGSLVKSTGPNLNKWDRRFFRIAEEISHWSKDIGTKVGCVLVANRHIISCGFNGFPEGIADLSDRFEDREWKLAVTVHAEVNAILNAGKHGARTEGSTLYTTFSPCSNCSSAIIQAGITRVVCPPYLSAPERWRSNFLLGRSLLDEAGISITET